MFKVGHSPKNYFFTVFKGKTRAHKKSSCSILAVHVLTLKKHSALNLPSSDCLGLQGLDNGSLGVLINQSNPWKMCLAEKE
jgi:hypothetical protein